MGDMPRSRRRRDKKLMSMDEVNDRFPLTKYKTWRATREQKGLPAAGGVTAPPSRAGSIKDHALERVSTENCESVEASDPKKSVESVEVPEHLTEIAQEDPTTQKHDFAEVAATRKSHEATRSDDIEPQTVPQSEETATNETTEETTTAPVAATQTESEKAVDEEEDDPIMRAVPADLLNHPGDACAICIETLEDDDEVRGLTCGHAFHAGCVDPWLTSRRACCPLCKTDYYVPKPRPEGENVNDGSRQNDASGVNQPEAAHIPGGQARANRTRLTIAGSPFTVTHHDRFGFPILTRDRPRRPPQNRGRSQSEMRRIARGEVPAESQERTQGSPMTWIRTLPDNLPRPRLPFFASRRNATEQNTEQPATPSQLEAGAR